LLIFIKIIHIINGNITIEKKIHKYFQNFNIKNEWFIYNDEIINFINFLKLGNDSENYIFHYFKLKNTDNEILLEIYKLWLVIEIHFGNKIKEEYNIFFEKDITLDKIGISKYEIIKIIFDNKIDYEKMLDIIFSYRIEEYY
jgi:hypothetical protein